MITDIKKILTELSYRVKDGSPDFENEQHLIKLYDVLREFKWPVDARIELIKTLTLTEETWWDKLDSQGKAKYIAQHGGPPKHRDAKDLGSSKKKKSSTQVKSPTTSTPINRKDSMDKSSEHIQEEKSEGQKKKDKESKEKYDKLKEENQDLDSKERKEKSEKIVSSKLSSEDKARQLAGLVDGTTETTVNLIESVNDGLDEGKDLPAGTPESTFAEKGGVQRARTIRAEMTTKRDQIAKDSGRKSEDISDEEVIDAMADDEVANPKNPLSKGKSKAWVKTMLRTAASQQQSLDDNAEEYDCDVPAEILGGGVSDERTITTLKSHCDSEIESADKVLNDPNASEEDKERAQRQKDHYEFTKKWLDNPDTDSFLLYKTKDGHMAVKHISNKKGFKDPALNTSVLQRGRKTKEKAKEVAKEREMTQKDAQAMEENLEKTTEESHQIVKDADAGMKQGNRDVSARAVKSKDKKIKRLTEKREKRGLSDKEKQELKKEERRLQEAGNVTESAEGDKVVQRDRQKKHDAVIEENKETIDTAFEVLDENGKPDPDRSGLKKGEEIGRVKGRWYFWDEESEDWKAVTKTEIKNRLGKENVIVNGEKKKLSDVVMESDDAGKEIGVLDTVIEHGEGVIRNTDEFGEMLTSGRGGLPGKSYNQQTDYAVKVLNTGSNGGGRNQVEPFLKHSGWSGTAKDLQSALKKARKDGNIAEVRRLSNIVARAVSMSTAGGDVTDNTSKLTTKLSQKLTEIRSADDAFPDKNSLDSPPSGQGSAATAIKRMMKKDGLSFEEAKKKYIMERYNIQSEEEYQAVTNQGEHLGALTGDGDSSKSTWKKYTGSMAAAHEKMVGDIVGRDDKWKKKQKWEDDDPRHDENGPEAEAYVRTFMDQMHWEQYILGEAPRKAQSIDGHEVTPKMYYKCLSDLADASGFKSKSERGSKEHREELVKWLGKNAKPHPDDDSISIGPDVDPKDGRPDIKLGKDEMRTAGTAKKAHGYNGDDLTNCLMEEAGAK